MKEIITIVAVTILSINLVAQKTTNFSGAYSLEDAVGKANYSYYDNENYERIYQGVFTFTSSSYVHLVGDCKFYIKGNFIENKPDGVWTYSIISKDNQRKTTYIAKFNKGIKIGTWESKYEDTYFKKQQKIITNFNNDTLKSIKYITNLKTEVDVFFNENGCLTGETKSKIAKPDEVLAIWKVNNCSLTFYLEKNMATGEIIKKRESNEKNRPFQLSDLNENSQCQMALRMVMSYWDKEADTADFLFLNPIFNYFPNKEINGKQVLKSKVLFN